MVDLGRGTAEDFEAQAAEIPGRIVLVRHEYMFATGHVHRWRKYLWARERSAAGFLIASPVPGEVLVTSSFGTGASDDIPAAGITQEEAAAQQSSLRSCCTRVGAVLLVGGFALQVIGTYLSGGTR